MTRPDLRSYHTTRRDYLFFVNKSPRTVLSPTAPQLFPLRDRLYFSGRENFASALQRNDVCSTTNSPDIFIVNVRSSDTKSHHVKLFLTNSYMYCYLHFLQQRFRQSAFSELLNYYTALPNTLYLRFSYSQQFLSYKKKSQKCDRRYVIVS
jgi:hypothetical protein